MAKQRFGLDRSSSRRTLAASLVGALLLAVGCSSGGGNSSGGTSNPLVVSVTVTGGAQTRLGATTQFSALVANSANQAVTWQVNNVTGGSTATGTISATGLYTAPAAIPAVNPLTITAVSPVVGSIAGTFSEAVWNPLPVLNANGVTVTATGSSGIFLIDVRGTGFVQNAAIQVNGSSVTTTFLSSSDLQANFATTAGTTANIAVVNPNPGSATSASAPVQFGTSVSVTVTGAAQTRLGATTQFSASVSNTSNQAVTWQVNGTTGGSTATGTISATGLYTPPAAIPSQNPITISAVSPVANSVTGTLSEAIWNPVPTVTTIVATESGTSTSFLIDARGTGFVQGAVIQVGAASLMTTFISATELQANYTAPGAGTAAIDVMNPAPGSTTTATSNVQLVIFKAALAAAARVLDQSSFGPTLNSIQHVQTVGLDAYITEQIQTPATLLADLPNPLPVQCFPSNPIPCEQAEWWQTVITGPDQLRQRVAFALSELMVISTNGESPSAIIPYQNMLATDAFGNFSKLLKDMTLSTGMGLYLNMLNSYKPGSGQIANENYAREAMQLFTIGLNQLNADGTPVLDGSGNMIPTYTEAQVQAFARAYTGWTWANAGGGTVTKFPNNAGNYDSPMAQVESAHDVAAKILLNGTTLPAGQTAAQDLDGALTNLFNHPNVGPFLSRQLIQHLVASNPTPAYVGRVAAVFADNGSGVRGDMAAVIRAILTDTEARAGDADATAEGGHLREPILYLANSIRGLGFVNTDSTGYYGSLSNYSGTLSQKPYGSGSVFNFFPPDYVLPGTTVNAPEFALENTASAILRLSLANYIVYNGISGFSVDLSATGPLGMMASNPGNLVDSLGVIFMHGQMPLNMRTAIVNHITTLTDMGQRVRVATYLVLTSSQYKVEH